MELYRGQSEFATSIPQVSVGEYKTSNGFKIVHLGVSTSHQSCASQLFSINTKLIEAAVYKALDDSDMFSRSFSWSIYYKNHQLQCGNWFERCLAFVLPADSELRQKSFCLMLSKRFVALLT